MGTMQAPPVAVGFPGGDAVATRPYAPPQRMWPATFRSVHRARHALEVTLREWELSALADAAGLALSELMGNAVEHAHVPGRLIGVSVFRLDGGGVALEVHDAEDEQAPLRAAAAAPYEDRGRGLTLVDAVTCGRWGSVKRDGPGKVVWAELRTGMDEALSTSPGPAAGAHPGVPPAATPIANPAATPISTPGAALRAEPCTAPDAAPGGAGR